MNSEKEDTLRLRLMTKADVIQVAHLMAKIFSESEPVSVHYKDVYGETVDDVYKTYALPETENSVADEMSFVVVDDALPADNQIIAFGLCRKLQLSDTKPDCEVTYAEAFDVLLNKCTTEYLKLHPETKCCDHAHGVAIGVKDDYKRNSLAVKLIQAAINAASSKGFKYFVSAPTSSKIVSLCKVTFGMKKVYSYPLADFDFNGIKYFEGVKGISNFEYFELDLRQYGVNG